MKQYLLLATILAVAACVEAAAGPDAVAREYFSKTYFNTDRVTYNGVNYYMSAIGSDAMNITMQFTRVLDAPSYTLTRTMEETITLEKKGEEWDIVYTSPVRILTEAYAYK